jgi:Fic family protein
MRTEDFISPSGQIVQTLEGHKAFVPFKLPPQIDLLSLINPLGEAVQLLSELRGAARRTENPYVLIEPLQRREALTTSAMEGTFTSIENLVLEEENVGGRRDENSRETFNYIVALRNAVAGLQKYPISHRIIKEAHARLLSGLSNERGANKRPGEYKQHQNWIGGGRDIKNARYVPPPPELTQGCMDDIEKYVNREDVGVIQKVIDLAIVHYQFEAVHPFGDGNGRIGRMLVTLMAVQSELLELPILLLSPHLEKHKNEYIDLMYNVTTRSEWTEWLKFFLTAINATCRDTIAKIDTLIALQKDFKNRAAQAGRSSKLIETVDMLFNSPVTTVPRMMERHKITYRAALLIIEKLMDVGILQERANTTPKYFIAPEIIAATNRD